MVSICDCDPAALERAQYSFPTAACTSEYEDILKNSDIDAVVIATPASLHPSLVEQALDCGNDVLVEKPFSVTAKSRTE